MVFSRDVGAESRHVIYCSEYILHVLFLTFDVHMIYFVIDDFQNLFDGEYLHTFDNYYFRVSCFVQQYVRMM